MSKPKGIAPANSNPLPPVPPGAIRAAKIGGTIALGAAAAMSAQTLVALGHILGYHGQIAWLLPASLDVYAATSIWVGYRIPAAHPASVIARRDAVLALTLTVCCNALYHLLLLAGSALPKSLIDTLLVLVGALPPLVVERIFHLQMSVRNGNEEAGVETVEASSPVERKASIPTVEASVRKASVEAEAPKALSSAAPDGNRAASASASDATRPASASKPSAGNRATATLPIPINRKDRVEAVRSLIQESGGTKESVPLKAIQDMFGVSQATASRMRDEAAGTKKDDKPAAADASDEPERVWGAS